MYQQLTIKNRKKKVLHRISRLEKDQHLLEIKAGNQQLKWQRVVQLKGKTVDTNQHLVKTGKGSAARNSINN
jgi:hypothetical protein